jgi:alanine-glyoxylate transaminase/serine-glyoxylate transaminase/serine-pyruvate transaminase
VLEEGLPAVYERHRAAGARLQDGLVELGLDLFARDGHRLPELTTVWVPDGVDSAKTRHRLLTEYGIEIGAGAGHYASTVWRIGLMGHNARLDRAELLLAALRDVLS